MTLGSGTGLNGGRLIVPTYYSFKASINDGTFPLGQNDRFDDSPADGVHYYGHHPTMADIFYTGTKGYLQ